MQTSATPETTDTGLLIGGEVVSAPDADPVHDPGAPSEVVGHAASAAPEQAVAAIDAAERAWPEWSARSAADRAGLLTAALDALEADTEERARLLTRENGKVIGESRIELGVFAARCRLAAELAPRVEETEQHAPPPFRSRVERLSLGVVTIIVPYNWPLAILAASLPYALVAGNTVVVKPPPATPLSVVKTLEILARGLPAGVLNVITGSNDAVAPLITDPRISRLVFTGSTGAGRTMMKMAAENMTRVTLELGGNDAGIVLDDADLDADAIQRLVVASHLTTGQVCMGLKRLYVHRSRYDEVVSGMSEVLSAFVVGHGLTADVTMGPLNTERQRDFVAGLKREAEGAGAEVRDLGTVLDEATQAGGWFLPPSLVLDPSPTLSIVTEEQFGPALPILPFDDVEDAVAAVNHDWSGLCSSVWSADEERATTVARRLRTGTTWINNHNAVAEDDRAPFGGFRLSGIGRELGEDGLLEFVEPHSITYHG
jgi:acyl-CoA reductase-like NAD-dependent aldehyde dehydrogenase